MRDTTTLPHLCILGAPQLRQLEHLRGDGLSGARLRLPHTEGGALHRPRALRLGDRGLASHAVHRTDPQKNSYSGAECASRQLCEHEDSAAGGKRRAGHSNRDGLDIQRGAQTAMPLQATKKVVLVLDAYLLGRRGLWCLSGLVAALAASTRLARHPITEMISRLRSLSFECARAISYTARFDMDLTHDAEGEVGKTVDEFA